MHYVVGALFGLITGSISTWACVANKLNEYCDGNQSLYDQCNELSEELRHWKAVACCYEQQRRKEFFSDDSLLDTKCRLPN